MNKYQLVVFDFDGTLIDSDLALIKIGLKMSEVFLPKKDVSIDDYLYLNGPSLSESMPLIFPDVPFEEIRAKYNELAVDSARDMTLFKNGREILDYLQEKKIGVALFTSRYRLTTELVLKQKGIFNDFKMIVCGDDGFSKKPSGEGLKHISDKLKIDPKRMLFVGDNWRDVVAGSDAGVVTVFIKSHRRHDKLDIKADYEINDLIEIKEVIENE